MANNEFIFTEEPNVFGMQATQSDYHMSPGGVGVGIPSGGTEGQVLAKNSDADYDAGWIDPPETPEMDAEHVTYDDTETYTDGTVGSAITEIRVKTETVTGSTPSITGVANTRYICGEVSTLSITPPNSGIIDVIFTSGTSPTILTLPNTVIMPDWFSVEASTTYEINIADGVYGTVMAWA